MRVGDRVKVSGYLTKEKFVVGRTLIEMEDILGYQRGRFAEGIVVAHPTRLPLASEFETAGYSMVAKHKYNQPTELNLEKLKQNAMASWATFGWERLVKVWPNMPPDDKLDRDTQYPPGDGAPQWNLTAEIDGIVVDVVDRYPDGRYRPKA
jgi:hypothetical protein